MIASLVTGMEELCFYGKWILDFIANGPESNSLPRCCFWGGFSTNPLPDVTTVTNSDRDDDKVTFSFGDDEDATHLSASRTVLSCVSYPENPNHTSGPVET